jgi:hypothetical protein
MPWFSGSGKMEGSMQVPMLASMKGEMEGTQGRVAIYPWSSHPVSCPDRFSAGWVEYFVRCGCLAVHCTHKRGGPSPRPSALARRTNSSLFSSDCLAASLTRTLRCLSLFLPNLASHVLRCFFPFSAVSSQVSCPCKPEDQGSRSVN